MEKLEAELRGSREQTASLARAVKEERANAARGWEAAKRAEEGLEMAKARAEDAYGKVSCPPITLPSPPPPRCSPSWNGLISGRILNISTVV